MAGLLFNKFKRDKVRVLLGIWQDPRVIDGQDIQTTITHNAAFQTDDLDAYDSDCDDISSAKVVLMANLSSYGPDVLSEAPSELPKVSMVKKSFQKLKNHLASFDKVMKVRTTPDAITKGSWGFEHTKAVFKQEIYSMAGSDDENPPPPPPPQTPTQQAPHTVLTIKLPILKKGEFGANDESKKMQKYILKQQFEGFSVSNSEGLHKGYDRFQSLLSQLEIHGAGVSECQSISSLALYPSSWPSSTRSSSMCNRMIHLCISESTSSTNDAQTLRTDEIIKDSMFTYGPKQSKTSESDTQTSNFDSCESNSSVETLESVPEPVVIEPKVNKGIVIGISQAHDWEQAYLVENIKTIMEPVSFEKNKVLFTDTECLVLSYDFKFPDENQVLLRIPRQNNMYSFNLANIVPSGGLACLIAKATVDESNKWHRSPKLRSKDEGEKANKDTDLRTNEEASRSGGISLFRKSLKGLKRQEPRLMMQLISYKGCAQDLRFAFYQADCLEQQITNTVNTVRIPISTASSSGGPSYPDLTNYADQDDSQIPALEDIYDNPNDGIFTNASYDDEGAVADFTNLESTVNVSPIPTSRIHSIHPTTQILRDPKSAVQTRSKVNKSSRAHAFISYIQKQRRNNHKDFQYCLFAYFLSQIEPKKISEALEDENLPYEKKAIGTKWVYRNKHDERGVVVRNKARIFLAFASYMGFIVYHMDVKSAFLYGTIDEEVYVSQPSGFVDPKFPKKVYKVVKALYSLHQAPRAWSLCDEFEALMKIRFQMSSIGELTFFLGLQVKQKEDGIFISQDKYVAEILKKFDFASVKTTSTPIETQKPLTKDEESVDVDVHLYRSMIGSLMHLAASRPDIMFAVCTSRANSNWAFGVLGCHNLTWKPTQIVTMLEQILTGNPQQDVVNFLAGDLFHSNARSRQLWLLLLQRQNMLLLPTAVGKFCRFKIKLFHSKTKHIEIRHHFIRDAYEKKLIQVLKIHTDDNVADLLTKAFDVSRHQELASPEQTASALAIPAQTTTATASTNVHGEVKLTASIDGQAKTITEASLRRHLKLEDDGGITCLPNTEIFNNIAAAIICLSTNRTFNFSKFIFDAMVKNLDNPHKFLMYPRFIQICLNKQMRLLQPHTRTYPTPVLTQKVFSNMRQVTRGYSGDDIPLFPSMITTPETSPSRITSSPSLSPQHTPVSAPLTSPPIPNTTPIVEEPAPMPHESPLQSVHSLGCDEGSVSLNELMALVT
ncbi:putative ribonuclease H-like domain-containing protein [Tanacetum coccineum]